MRRLTLAVPQLIPGFFANAGQSAVERAIVETLPDTGRVHLRIIALGTRDEHEQLAEYCGPRLRDGRVSVVPFTRKTQGEALAGLDGMILHGLSPLPALRRWLCTSRVTRRLPVVLHLHSLFLAPFEFALYDELWADWRGWPPATWVAPSECCARRARFLRQPPPTCPPVAVIPHGVLGVEVASGDRMRGRGFLGARADDIVVLSLARLTEEKCDYRVLIRALTVLRQTTAVGKRVRLVLTGGMGPDDEEYVDRLRGLVVALDLSPWVRIIDNLEDDKKADVLAAADLFVSLACNPQESFGIALLEAQAVGLPIVASEWNGYPEVLAPFYRGRMVPTVASPAYSRTLDWRRLSDAGAIEFTALVGLLRRFLENPGLRADAARAGPEHARRYAWRDTAERLVDLWEDLTARHRAGPHSPTHQEADGEARRDSSPVEGLATYYTEPHLRVRVAAELPVPAARDPMPAPPLRLLSANLGGIVTVAQWREACGELGDAWSDSLLLQLIRTGAVSASLA